MHTFYYDLNIYVCIFMHYSETSYLDQIQASSNVSVDMDHHSENQILQSSIQVVNDDSQNSTLSTTSNSSKSRRLPNILSVASSQKACFLCKDTTGRRRIPKEALAQVWIEKTIMIPHENRSCGSHLSGKEFTDAAMQEITPTTHGVLMSDEELSHWILDLSQMCKMNKEKRKRFDFEDPKNVPEEDYPILLGVTKANFDTMLSIIKSSLHKSVNRTPREALAMFMMVLRHGMTQVFTKYNHK